MNIVIDILSSHAERKIRVKVTMPSYFEAFMTLERRLRRFDVKQNTVQQ